MFVIYIHIYVTIIKKKRPQFQERVGESVVGKGWREERKGKLCNYIFIKIFI